MEGVRAMPLTVLNVAYPRAPVRPETAGGAEQVVAMLDRALVRAGHRSMVCACEGSQVEGTLITGRLRRLTDLACDLIHLHGLDFLEYLPEPGVPVLVTLHLPIAWYDRRIFSLDRPDTWLHCVSLSQHADCPAARNLLPPIENGVPEIPFAAHVHKRNYVAALGRICPEKGYHIALDAAKEAGIPLLLAGQVFPYADHVRYYVREIIPRCNLRRRFIGPVGPDEKRRLLSAARCLLVPSQVAETSSLVAMEALMCGTPVVAFPSGALAEIVEDGVTGFHVRNASEMAAAIARCREVDPAACREAAMRRFSERRAIAEYFRAYEWITKAGSPDRALPAPRLDTRTSAAAGLQWS